MRWEEKEQGRELDETEVETEREEKDNEILPDIGRMCGKRERENPLISRQHWFLLQGFIFLFFLI